MKRTLRIGASLVAIAAGLIVIWPYFADAQTAVLQSGPATQGHAPIYVGTGQQAVVMDSGTAAGGGNGVGLSELSLAVRSTGLPPYANAGTGPNFTNLCDYDGPTTSSGGYHWLCLGPNSNGAAVISTGAGGSASPQPLNFVINGATYPMGSTGWLSSWLDNQFGSTPGNVLYRGATGWAALAPGNSGQVLQTLGTASPYVAWANVTGTGTVTSITAGTGLTGGTITGSGTIALANPVAVNLGGSGVATATAHAAILGEGTGPFAFAAPGVAGTCLASNGVGADPSFQSCPGTGTVSSVGLSDESTTPIFNIGGTPVTVSGTLTETLKNQNANTIFAGPTTGSAAQPIFRAMVDADLPGGVTGSGAVVLANSPTLASPTTTGVLTTAASALAGAGVNLPPGVAPSAPNNGDIWTTSAGLFARVNGSTVGPMGANAPAGVTSNVQFNNAGVFAGNSGFTYDGTSVVSLGVSRSSVGSIGFNNLTSGSISLAPPTGALGTVTLTLPDVTDTVTANAASQTLTNKTMGSGDTWNGNVIGGTYGGTGINNGASTLTLGASFTLNGGGTLSVASGKTLTSSNTLTLAGMDGSTINVGAGGTLGTAAFQNTGTSGATLGLLNGNLTFGGSNAYGTPASITLTNATGLTLGGMANLAANSIIGNNTGSSATPIALTSAQSQALLMIQPTPQGRLTLTTGTPVMAANATAQSTVYYDCYDGQYVPVWDGTEMALLSISSCEISMGLDAVTPHVASGSVYDIFAVNNSGALAVCIGPAWSSTTARGTGAGTTQIHNTKGVWTNQNSLTHCWGGASGTTDLGTVAADHGTYLGSLYATANGQTGMNMMPAAASGGGNATLALYNAYNRVAIIAGSQDSTTSWTYATSTVRPANNSTSNRITWLDGLQQSFIKATYIVQSSSGGAQTCANYVGINTTSGITATLHVSYSNNSASVLSGVARGDNLPLLGLNYAQALEFSTGSTCTYEGDASMLLSAYIMD